MIYFDTEQEVYLNEEELEAEYNSLDDTEANTFREYLTNCTSKNGTLEKVTFDDFEERLIDLYLDTNMGRLYAEGGKLVLDVLDEYQTFSTKKEMMKEIATWVSCIVEQME